jgi:hypothetical protein
MIHHTRTVSAGQLPQRFPDAAQSPNIPQTLTLSEAFLDPFIMVS